MNIHEISSLIQVRNYVYNAISNFSIDKKIIKQLNDLLIFLDKRITEELASSDFKESIGLNDEKLKEAVSNAVKANDIRKDMKFT